MMMHLAHSTTVLTEFIAWLYILSYQLSTVLQVFHLLIWSKQASKWNIESWLTSERKFKIDGVHSQQIVTQLKKRWPVVCTWVSGVSDLCTTRLWFMDSSSAKQLHMKELLWILMDINVSNSHSHMHHSNYHPSRQAIQVECDAIRHLIVWWATVIITEQCGGGNHAGS